MNMIRAFCFILISALSTTAHAEQDKDTKSDEERECDYASVIVSRIT
jgi:hypothetical protein